APAQGSGDDDQALARAGHARRHPVPPQAVPRDGEGVRRRHAGKQGRDPALRRLRLGRKPARREEESHRNSPEGREGEPLGREAENAARPRPERQAAEARWLGRAVVAILAGDAADDDRSGGRRRVQRATAIRPRRRVPALSKRATVPRRPTSWRSYSRIATFPAGCWVACAQGRRRERPGGGGWGG